MIRAIAVKESQTQPGDQIAFLHDGKFLIGHIESGFYENARIRLLGVKPTAHVVIPYNTLHIFKVQYTSDMVMRRIGDVYEIKALKEPKTVLIPLKYSQWQAAINNKEVNTDKQVPFEEIAISGKAIAKVLPTPFDVSVMMGVGEGSGNHFVHGSYETIKMLQEKLIAEEERRRNEVTKAEILAMLEKYGVKSITITGAVDELFNKTKVK